MKFGPVKTADARGCILAHALRLPDGRLAKGKRLTAADLRACADAGITELTVLRLDAGDVLEDVAVARAAKAIAGTQLRVAKPVAGRANIFARAAGLFRVDAEAIAKLNALDPMLTVATLPDRQPVVAGRLAATVKAISFAVKGASVGKWEKRRAPLRLASYRKLRAGLIQTVLPTTKPSLLAKGVVQTEQRLAACGAALVQQQTCAHEVSDLAAAIAASKKKRLNLLLILGASSVCDPRDVVPAALRASGGRVKRVGMPVDPGNLMVLGQLGAAQVVGMPSCARSPKENGFDWVLRRICAGEKVDAAAIAGMGAGGLLDEVQERPARRMGKPAPATGKNLAAVVLAAGSSRRMGKDNKLLQPWRGQPLLLHAVKSLLRAKQAGLLSSVVAVLGHERTKVAKLLRGLDVIAIHNPAHATGMASTLKAGIASLGSEIDGAFVCLGDMPQLDPALLDQLAAAFDPAAGKDIVVPDCDGKYGHPKLFGASYFDDIMRLEGDVGAQAVIGANRASLALVPAGREVLFDIDTPAQRAKK